MTQPIIRPLRASDRKAWDPLWQGYLTFYRASLTPETTETTWQRLLDPAETVKGFVAEVDGELVGFTHYLMHRSTWADWYCYLEDLFVAPDGRGEGTGRLLIEAVADEARKAGAKHLYWLTHETNAVAQVLYNKVAERTGFIHYRKGL